MSVDRAAVTTMRIKAALNQVAEEISAEIEAYADAARREEREARDLKIATAIADEHERGYLRGQKEERERLRIFANDSGKSVPAVQGTYQSGWKAACRWIAAEFESRQQEGR